jgi:CheY-like chemotaxis protein
MPMLDGFEVLKIIKLFCAENCIPTPTLVAVTGHSEPEYVDKAKECGADYVLSKPPNPGMLKTLVMNLNL